MVSKQPFARRILIAFVLMTTLVSGLFSLSIVAVVHFIEANLVSDELDRELSKVLQEDILKGRSPRLDAATQFFSSEQPQFKIPELFSNLPEGFSEIVEGTDAYHVFSRKENGQTYLLTQEQQEFEAHEQALFNVVLAGFLLTVVSAWGLGLIMARKVMAPLSRLAQQVRHRDWSSDVCSPICPTTRP